MIKKLKGFAIIFIGFVFSYICCVENKEIEDTSIIHLTKIKEFEANFSHDNEVISGQIDSFCFDAENNVYIADSGWNKIFKFGQDGNYMTSFGQEGQGPGEFMGDLRGNPLKISFGNDGNFYVYDLGLNRLSFFSNNFEFIKSYTMPLNTRIIDTPVVSSTGDIYLVARIENKLIHRLDNNVKLKSSFLDSEDHFKFPFHKPEALSPFVGEFDLRKAITREDHIIAVSNYSLTVFHFNEKDELINKFNINNKLFINDFSECIKSLKKDKKRRKGIFLPFYLFIDQSEKICLCYFNSSIGNYEVYRYKKEDALQDVLRFPEKVTIPIECDHFGNIYAKKREGNEMTIGKYQIKN